jgi:high-affinity nickel permease
MSSAQPNNSGTYMTLLSILVLGLFLGMRHAADADHVVAVTTLDLIAGVRRGDKILSCDGVAIGKVNHFDIRHSDFIISNHVPGHSR